VLSSPKHKDSRLLLIKIARIIADDDNMFQKAVEKEVHTHERSIKPNKSKSQDDSEEQEIYNCCQPDFTK